MFSYLLILLEKKISFVQINLELRPLYEPCISLFIYL
jgi:hypothetical protein